MFYGTSSEITILMSSKIANSSVCHAAENYTFTKLYQMEMSLMRKIYSNFTAKSDKSIKNGQAKKRQM